jgi:hypothetical protein
MPKDEEEIIDNQEDAKETGEGHPNQSERRHNTRAHRGSRMWLMVASIVVGILLIFATVGFAKNMFIAHNRSSFATEPNFVTTFTGRGRSNMMNRIFIDDNSSDTSTTSTSATSGVVTSVKSTSFIIAGNGNQYTVNTTGDTTFNTTDKKVAVNDSVVVVGTISSDKTITATDVRVTNF